MGDVSDGGEWVYRQTRQLKELLVGYTPFSEGDVLFAKITPCMENGKGAHATGLKHGIGFGSTEFHVLRARQHVSERFLFHLSQTKHLRLAAETHMIGSAGQQRVQKQFFDRYEVQELPFAEQKKVAQILDTLDTQIHQTEALIAKLEQMKQGLLTDLLTRGIDQNGQLRPTPDQTPHLYKDSPLGWIPRGWAVVPVGDVGEVVTGSTPPSSDPKAWGDSLPFFTPVDVFGYESLHFAERAISDAGRRYIRETPAGSTLVVCIGSTIGKVGFTSRSGATNQQINAVIPSTDWDKYFVFQAIRAYIGQIQAWAGLQAVPIVNKSTFSKMLIPRPGLEEQRVASQRLGALDKRISDERALMHKLVREKEGLMEDLLTGRVRVAPLLENTKQAHG